MQIKEEQRSLKTSLADESFPDHHHRTALISHSKEEKPCSEKESNKPTPY